MRIKDVKWRILHRLHPRYKYQLIKTGLKPNYYDEDTLMLHGCMALLCRYVESHGSEKDMEEFNTELRQPADSPEATTHMNAQADRQEEALAIYRWWKYTKPEDDKKIEDITDKIWGTEYRKSSSDERATLRALEEKVAKDEQDMLHRLINIRPGLWT